MELGNLGLCYWFSVFVAVWVQRNVPRNETKTRPQQNTSSKGLIRTHSRMFDDATPRWLHEVKLEKSGERCAVPNDTNPTRNFWALPTLLWSDVSNVILILKVLLNTHCWIYGRLYQLSQEWHFLAVTRKVSRRRTGPVWARKSRIKWRKRIRFQRRLTNYDNADLLIGKINLTFLKVDQIIQLQAPKPGRV